MRKVALLAAVAAALAVGVGSAAAGGVMTLTGTVGPSDTIVLMSGTHKVTSLKAGTYAITIHDLATDHNFHLTGPGVNKSTTVAGTGTVVWHVKLTKGTYRYVCDPHASFMKGLFTVRQ